MRTALLILCFTLTASANPFSKTVHYVSAHKQIIARDFVIAVPIGGDVWSSVNCQHTGRCFEQNPILGSHPSTQVTIGYGIGVTGALIACNHLIPHFAPDSKTAKILPWFSTVPLATKEVWEIQSNIELTGKLSRTSLPVRKF